MSDNFLRLIPTDPSWQPDTDHEREALAVLRRLVPGADDVQGEYHEEVTFIDQGANFEELRCHICGAVIPMDWFEQKLDRESFSDLSIVTPCCGVTSNLNELDFRWPAASLGSSC